jgi:hypothetical protein
MTKNVTDIFPSIHSHDIREEDILDMSLFSRGLMAPSLCLLYSFERAISCSCSICFAAEPKGMLLSVFFFVTVFQVNAFVNRFAGLCQPENVHVCNGTQEEFDKLMGGLVKQGTVAPLDPEKRPGWWVDFTVLTVISRHLLMCSYIGWTDPADVARAEKDTFICSVKQVCEI